MNYLLGGRNGDLMQILPALKYEADRSCEPLSVICSREFAPLLDGVSYCEATPYDGAWDDVNRMLAFAKSNFPDDGLINCSIYGRGWRFQRRESNYQRDIWRNTGCPYEFGTLPLVFDRRSEEREEELIDQWLPTGPCILTHFASVSSPFPWTSQITACIEAIRPDLQVVDLSHIRAERLYDVLGLMECSRALVCCDSAMLHLSRAVPNLPVLAFLSDQKKPWNTSEPHSGVIWHSPYSWISRNAESFKAALKSL